LRHGGLMYYTKKHKEEYNQTHEKD
jgi:hypothetical protein